MTFKEQLQAARARWYLLAPRERGAIVLAAIAVALTLIWMLLLGPALSTLRQAERQHQELDAQLQAMRALQSEAMALKEQPRLEHDDALRALETSVTQRLAGSGTLSVVGERATVTLKAAEPDALARWLTQARVNARALPAEARLTRAPSQAGQPARWDGTLILTLPPR